MNQWIAPGVAALALWLPGSGLAQPAAVGGPLKDALTAAQQRVVKLYGAGVGRIRGYGSGVIVSPDGRILTVLSSLLESEAPRVVLPDGRRFTAVIAARDTRRQLALLQIEANELPFFPLGESTHLMPGDWLIAAANPFKVADGAEPVSVSLGVFAGRTTLDARRRAQDFPYDGPILLTDAIVSTPGSAGGALLEASGALVGLIGKEVESRRTNTWVNYALPVEELAAFLAAADDPDWREPVAEPPAAAASVDLGIRLFDVGGSVRPAYIERVRPGSPAARAGVQPDDLIVSLNGQPIATCEDYSLRLAGLRPAQPVELILKRGRELLTVTVEPEVVR
jgi:S1-C subfamily serine protease